MKKVKDYRKEVASRKPRIPNTFYYWFYRTVMHFISIKYHPHYTREVNPKDIKGPAFVVFNHLSRIDHAYVMESMYPKKLNILAGYNEFFRSHLHWAFKMNRILPCRNYANDMMAMRGMMSIIKQGGIVAFAPEGLASNDGMNKPVVPSTGHMFRHFGVPVYFVELRGQYLQNTKVCLDERYGETYATLKLLFSPEDLASMTDEEIETKLNEAFRHDEYEWQKEKNIKWDTRRRVCYRLDDLLYQCPKCHAKFNMETGNDYIKCKCCGNGTTMDEYYSFHPYPDSVIPDTPSRWVDEQRIDIIKEIRANKDFSFSEEVVIGRIPNDHLVKNKKTSEPVSKGTLTIDHSGVHYKAHDDSKFDFNLTYKQVYTTITELDASYINIYVNGEFTDIFPERKTAMYMNYLIEEMHRLHVNYYKNFPWNSYMYEGMELPE